MDTKEKKKPKQKKNEMHARVSRSIEEVSRGVHSRILMDWGSYWAAIEHPESFSINRGSYQEAVENAIKNSWRVLIGTNLSRAIEKLSRWVKTVFQRREKQRLEYNQSSYPTKEPNIMNR